LGYVFSNKRWMFLIDMGKDNLVKKSNRIFRSDKISGFEGNLLFSSIILEVIKQANQRNRYKFPFYGLSLNLKREKGDEWIREKEYRKVCDKIIADYGRNGKKYFKKVKRTAICETAFFHKYTLKLIHEIPKMPERRLISEYKQFCKTYASYYGLGAITFLFEHILSERLTSPLLARYDNATEIISQLLESSYKSFMAKSDELLLKIKREKNKAKRYILIKKYQQDFFFMKTNYRIAPILTPNVILKMAGKIGRGRIEKDGSIKRINLKNIRLTEEEKNIIELLKIAEVVRDQRKQLNLTGSHVLGRFLDEIVRRCRIKKDIASRVFWYEYENLIKNKTKIVPRLLKRRKVSIVLEKNKTFYFGRVAIVENVRLKAVKEIKGTPASKGVVTGRSRIVLSSKNFGSFKTGEILIAEMTRPDFLPIMKKASAIITDEGGLTCHAAIVARELGIPCIVGTKIATRIIKNGQKIEVNGNKGIIKL